MAFRDTIRDIGLGLDTELLDRPYTPGAARFLGRALSSYGRTAQLHDVLQREAESRAAVKALETKLGVPAEFFYKLSAEAQRQILDRAGLTKADLKHQVVPGFGGKTYEELEVQGIPPSPAVNPADFGMEGPPSPGNPGLAPGAINNPTAVARYQGVDLRTPAERQLDDLNTAIKEKELANLQAGKTRSGGVPGGRGTGGREPMDVTAAKRLAETKGGDWRDYLIQIRNGQYKMRKTGAKQVSVYAPDGSQVTTFKYEYGGGVEPSPSHAQAPDPASLPEELQAQGQAVLSEDRPIGDWKAMLASPKLPKELVPFVQYRISQLGG